MYDWTTRLHLSPFSARLLVTDPTWGDRMKAVLPPRPHHPRALLTLLEGLALWHGQPLTAAISAGPSGSPTFARDFCVADMPMDSALVRLVALDNDRRQQRLFGLGDFRALRRTGRVS